MSNPSVRLEVGKRYRIKRFKRRPRGWNDQGLMDHFMGMEVTIKHVGRTDVRIEESLNEGEYDWWFNWWFNIEDFEEKGEEEIKIIQRHLDRYE